MDLVIQNGAIVTARETYKSDIAIQSGKIAAIQKHIEPAGADTIDATGLFVLPGAVDAHVHLQTPVGKYVSADSYESGTRAAACGGTTTVFDFCVQQVGKTFVESAQEMIKTFEKQACVDFSLHMVATDTSDGTLDQFKTIADFGIPSFKLYMVYKGLMVDDGALAEALEKSAATGSLIAVHAENPAIIEHRTRRLLSEGKTSAWHHYESRPEFVEAEAIQRAIHLAKAFRARLFIVHLACKEGLEEIRRARSEGYDILAETCPQYLQWDNSVYRRVDGNRYVCSPPIKGEDSRKALWEGLKNGDILTVATDHCPFQSYEKDAGKNDFTLIPNGCMGVENMYPYMLSAANKGRISFNKAVEVCSTNPANIFGCGHRKGSLDVGKDADIVLYDPKKECTITQGAMHSDADHTIWEGIILQGYPVMTLLRGKTVFKDGSFMGKAGNGEFVRCSIGR